MGTDTHGYLWYAEENYEYAQTYGGPTNWFTDFLCDVPIFKHPKRHTGSNAMPLVGEYIKNFNYSTFNGSLYLSNRTYNWFSATSSYNDGTSVVTEKHIIKVASDGEVLDIRDCSVGSTSTSTTTTNPSTPTTTVTYNTQSCPASFNYGTGQQYPSNFKVELGSGTGWVTIQFKAYDVPDKLIVRYLGTLVYDTGYLGDTTYQSQLDNELSNRGLPSETITQGSDRIIRWFKPQSYQVLDLEVYAPLTGTGWSINVLCPEAQNTTTTSSSTTQSVGPTTSTSSTSSSTSSSTTTIFPTTTTSTIDTDGDGIPDYLDPDDDNDGCYDEYDKYPLNPAFNADAFFKVYATSDLNMSVGIPSFTSSVESRSLRNVLMRQAYHHLVNLGNDFPEDQVIYDLGQTYFGTSQTLAQTRYPNDLKGYYYYNRRPDPDIANNYYSAPPSGSNIAIVPSEDDIDFNGGQNSFPQQNVSPYFAIINTNPGTVNDIIIVRWEDAKVVAVYTKGYLGNPPTLVTLT